MTGDNWRDYGRAAEQGPLTLIFKIIAAAAIIIIVVGAIGWVLGLFAETGKVAQQEFGPEALLEKYQWFKDASAQLDRKLADIKIYENRFKNMEESYGNVTRDKWSRTDRESYNLWQTELAGLKASYNKLAADYNSQMSKFNWRFANKGDLPKGATEPVPREYRLYVTE